MAPRLAEDGVEVDGVEESFPGKVELTESTPNANETEGSDEKNDKNEEEEEQQLFVFMKGIKEDLAARGPLYKSDWGRPKSIFTVINATVFAFVIQLIPALIFAELMDRETNGNLATAETLLSSGIMGIIYAIFAGQPLTIMGITGPVAILLGTSYGLTETFNAEYFPFFFWICIWAGLMHIISSMIGLVHLVWKVTPFTSQIFEFFIATTFIYAAVRDLIQPIYLGQGDYRVDRSAQYATLMIGLVTFGVAWGLHFAEQWVILTRQVRTFLTSYNTLLAVVIATALSYLPGVDLSENGAGGLDRVNIMAPWDWQPTADRPWVTDPFSGIDARGIFGAIIPGFMFFLLFIIDHNVSSILTQSPKLNLKKPPAYHWDFFVLGITFIPCAILGLPPGNGLIPQAPLHARALCTRKYVTDSRGVKHEVVTHCEEQRYSGLGQALLMFVALASFEVISWIPRGCLFGLFLYLGMGALHGNEIWERMVMCFMMAKKRPDIPIVREVKWSTVQIYTFVQAACGLSVFAVAQFASVGYIYPALLTALVPLRSYILSRVFSEADLKYLDPSAETDEELEEEQRAIRHNRNDSFDDSNDDGPHFGHFHPEAIKNELKKRKSSKEFSDGATVPPSLP
ncbi:bicarbonate transporter-like protein 11 [Seminavis robusta]|uniref:Bicarbonate transporter-like protein 11 n=1 Tax=Seminavis robusta TaxID=568900 RepID=A0A9N8F1Q8_9STRA|nr:bicarbonate transporter-like protein 11 [Seminavis robusta]|eukprot:Sro3213_g345380.1 bicarbonate transporter-like protein 11 (627) ;mRNA; r:4455-6519